MSPFPGVNMNWLMLISVKENGDSKVLIKFWHSFSCLSLMTYNGEYKRSCEDTSNYCLYIVVQRFIFSFNNSFFGFNVKAFS